MTAKDAERPQRGRPLLEPYTVRAGFFEATENGRYRCEACPRLCTMSPGQRGFCFVRSADEGGVRLTSYGRASGFCVDPIEKKPLNHFFPGSSVLSFGTAGCNLGCRFCQNWDISKSKAVETLSDAASPEQIAAAAERAGCRSVAYTYNDPTIFPEYAMDVSLACRERGVKNVAVTAGYITERAREPFFAAMDAANIDLKAFTEDFYEKLCFAKLGPVLDTLAYVANETAVWLEVTTLLIPGKNDSEAEVDALVSWFAETLGPDVPLHLTAYHPDFKLDAPPTPASTLARARRQAKAAGLRHVYTGNVHDADGQSTFCHGCGARVVERDWYRLGAWGLDAAGQCAECGTRVAGHYEAAPGTWGARRARLRVV